MNYILVIGFTLIAGFINTVSPQDNCRPGLCFRRHPQTIYCESEVVMRVRVHSTERDVRLNITGYSVHTYNKVSATVLRDFKPGSLERGTQIEFYTPSSFCGTWFDDANVYLITGSTIVDPTSGEEMWMMGNCDRGWKWKELPIKQRKGYTDKYHRFCKCPIAGVKSPMDLRLSLTEGGSGGYEPARSYWTPYRNCHYNPMKSEEYELEDCEEEFGFCRPTAETGVCSWQLNEAYRDCFEKREAVVFALEGASAITDIDQCRVIPNRRKRKACIKRVRQNKRLQAITAAPPAITAAPSK